MWHIHIAAISIARVFAMFCPNPASQPFSFTSLIADGHAVTGWQCRQWQHE